MAKDWAGLFLGCGVEKAEKLLDVGGAGDGDDGVYCRMPRMVRDLLLSIGKSSERLEAIVALSKVYLGAQMENI